ncbi:hypothetical protein FQN60_004434 [Etheostoma spectabile]|uniref:Methyltransferase type 11 domain-containing protein n=1 Tax=Etheostoma spectabile TaxID=54343 RepID=A0A5J5CYQ9_9PERO|nr:hypothetical protein FQN60_004434 [Etheostoma spectabile]
MAACYQGFDLERICRILQSSISDFERKDGLEPWKLACLHRAFTEGDVRGELLVDVGSGPSFYQVMSAVRFSTSAPHDFLEVNRQSGELAPGRGGRSMTGPIPAAPSALGRPSSAWTEKAASYVRSSWNSPH